MENFNQLKEAGVSAELHKQEIESSRVGGFGGSDAQLFLNIARKGVEGLSQTDLKRISVAMGITPFEAAPDNAHMRAGHLFEEHVNKMLFSQLESARKEELLENKFASSFRTFAHADFTMHQADGLIVYECKFVQHDCDFVLKRYMPQLQWYYLMGADRVQLIHGQGDAEPFSVKSIEHYSVDKNMNMIYELQQGIHDLELAIVSGWKPVLKDDDVIPFNLKLAFESYLECKNEIDRLTKQADSYKAEIMSHMEENAISNMVGDYMGETHTCTFIAGGQTRSFDSRKFLKAHPEHDVADYYKTTNRSSYIKIV